MEQVLNQTKISAFVELLTTSYAVIAGLLKELQTKECQSVSTMLLMDFKQSRIINQIKTRKVILK